MLTTNDLNILIAKTNARLSKYYGHKPGSEAQIMARTIKLMEEAGELAGQVLGFLGLQREAKLSENDARHLSDEIADVLIVTLLLAKALGIDPWQAIEDKMPVVNDRHAKDMEAANG